MKYWLAPDFDEECHICGTSPCVVVVSHQQPNTLLCGVHFFNDKTKRDWNLWNEDEDEETDQ